MVDLIGTGGQQLQSGPGFGSNPGTADLGNLGDTSGVGALFGNNSGLLAGLGAAGAGLGAGLLLGKGNDVPFQGELQGIAGTAGGEASTLFGEGQSLLQPLISGKLPPGAQASVDLATNAAKTASASRYASLGLTGSTMAGDAAANLDQQKAAMEFQIAQDMAKTGLSASAQSVQLLGLQEQAYSGLMQAQMKQDSSMMSTIGSFASSIGGAAIKAGFSGSGAAAIAPALLAV